MEKTAQALRQQGAVQGGGILIFVTVGTHKQQFNRLVKAVDDFVAAGKIKDSVIMQTGNSTYAPKNCKHFKFTGKVIIRKIQKNAKVIITHAGAGTIIEALSYKKPVIVVPRLKKFGEHTDDHQIDLADNLSRHGIVETVYDVNVLPALIRRIKPTHARQTKGSLEDYLGGYLESLVGA
ncbi:MAG: PssE/Cps14G family polysaccharide biosynthesis glycosyltransferase [Candidatus Aenigmatarchaeota archaeon]